MIVYVAASSSERERARWALAAVKDAPGLVLSHDWLEHIEAVGSANRGISPQDARRYAEAAVQNVLRASLLWLLVPTEPTFGAGVELGIAALAVRAQIRAPRFVIASGGRRDVSIFVGLAPRYFRTEAHALAHIMEVAVLENKRIAKSVTATLSGNCPPPPLHPSFDPTEV